MSSGGLAGKVTSSPCRQRIREAAARRLSAEGARIAVVDRDESRARRVADSLDGLVVTCDVTDWTTRSGWSSGRWLSTAVWASHLRMRALAPTLASKPRHVGAR